MNKSQHTQELIREMNAPITVVIKTNLQDPHESSAYVTCDGVTVHENLQDDPVLEDFINNLRNTMNLENVTDGVCGQYHYETFRASL